MKSDVFNDIKDIGGILSDHLLLLDPNYIPGKSGCFDIKTAEDMQQHLIKEIIEAAKAAERVRNHIINNSDRPFAFGLIKYEGDIKALLGCCRGQFNENNALYYFRALAALAANIRDVTDYFRLCGVNIREQITPIRTEEPKKNLRKKGRPKKLFKDLMLNDADGGNLEKIRAVMQGKKGKPAALVMLAAIDLGWIERPTHAQVTKEFGDIGVQQGFTKYLDKTCFSPEEIAGMKKALKG